MRLLVDAHLDLSWNALSYDRDQLLSVSELRASEAGMTGKSRGNCTVSLPEMRRAGVGVCLATLLCRALPQSLPNMDGNLGSIGDRRHGEMILREDLDYANQSIASAAAQGQLAYYRLLEAQGHLRMIRDAATLDQIRGQWAQGGSKAGAPIGYILSMEGADPIVAPRQAEWWWQQGLRTACLAHYGPSAYAMETGGDGPLTARGRELLQEFERLGIVLDLVHTADTAFAQALEIYSRPVFISHGNCRALVPHDRQISDEQIRQVVARGGVIGAVLDAWMLAPEYRRDDPKRPETKLAHVADHIDHVCQLAGNIRHSAIGSDLDGGFGTEQTPTDLDTIADLQKLAEILAGRGYGDADIDGIFHGNWLRFFREVLPQG
jgi:membrane dipeptidase